MNEYGLDYKYFEKRLKRMSDLSCYTPAELYRELMIMADVAKRQDLQAVLDNKPQSGIDE